MFLRESTVLLYNEPNLIVLFRETISVFMGIIGNVLMRYVFNVRQVAHIFTTRNKITNTNTNMLLSLGK